MQALVSQLFFLPDEESHIQALSPLIDLLEYYDDDLDTMHTLLHMLRQIMQMLTHVQAGSHAHQIAQGFLRFIETLPEEFHLKDRQKWSQATDHLLKCITHSSSPKLLANMYNHCGWGYLNLKELVHWGGGIGVGVAGAGVGRGVGCGVDMEVEVVVSCVSVLTSLPLDGKEGDKRVGIVNNNVRNSVLMTTLVISIFRIRGGIVRFLKKS